jgi:uncharacterized protein (TIGR03435 family)
MRGILILSWLVFVSSAAFGQTTKTPSFDVVSVKRSAKLVGPDDNNELTFSPAGFIGKNVTLKRLVAEAYRLQLNQVAGPDWLDRNEYEIEAKTERPVGREQLLVMLQSLLTERLNLKQHRETKSMKVYQLVTDKGGPKIRPVKEGEPPKAGQGFHFHGDLRQLADLLAVQLSIPDSNDADPTKPQIATGPPIPVLDKTGLSGTYDFDVELKPELGTGVFTVWQRFLREQLGLRIDSSKGNVPTIVVDNAVQVPTAN